LLVWGWLKCTFVSVADVDELLNVAERLQGPFNVENVIAPINVKISDAIMNFQESAETVTTRVYHTVMFRICS